MARPANDGNSATRWSSAYADNQWWEVDLGADRTIDRVELNWEVAYASRYRIRTRTSESSAWSTAASVTTDSPGLEVHTFTPRSARYVRISGDARGTQWGISLWDARVCDDDIVRRTSTGPDPNPDTYADAGLDILLEQVRALLLLGHEADPLRREHNMDDSARVHEWRGLLKQGLRRSPAARDEALRDSGRANLDPPAHPDPDPGAESERADTLAGRRRAGLLRAVLKSASL